MDALLLREKYMEFAQQHVYATTAKYLKQVSAGSRDLARPHMVRTFAFQLPSIHHQLVPLGNVSIDATHRKCFFETKKQKFFHQVKR